MTQPDFFSEPVAPFAKGSHTSWKAAKSFTLASRQTKVKRYLQLLASHGPLTDPEVSAITKWPRSSICSIRKHCETAMLVQRTGEERKSEYGKDCGVYAISEAGKRAVDAMREVAA